MSLPEALYSAAQTRQLDRLAIERGGISGGTLMERAGRAVFHELRTRWPRARRVVVVCGPGNNGGDGYVVARLAHAAGLETLALTVAEGPRLRGEALAAYEAAQAAGVRIAPFAAAALGGAELIVDALFGTGLEREVQSRWRVAIDAMNGADARRIAVDIPSGLHADAGCVLGAAVRAELTVSFIALKTGLFTGAARDHCGEIVLADLEVPASVFEGTTASAWRIIPASLRGLVQRRPSAHKGEAGHVAVIGGNAGMAGAARLAGEAAYRTGAGLVSLLTHPVHAAFVNQSCPELLTRAVEGGDLRAALRRATVLAIGPGLGQDDWGQRLFAAALESRLPKVIDADALNLLAADPLRREDWVLTPHPGEAARLLECSVADVEAQRFEALARLVERYGGVAVLKGAGTLVAAAALPEVWVCDAGNAGMASGGMGDVLTGVIAALLAQGLRPADAARLGVWLHATAADSAAADGEIGLLASDLLPFIRRRLHALR